MLKMKFHFNGDAIVLDEPLALPLNVQLTAHIDEPIADEKAEHSEQSKPEREPVIAAAIDEQIIIGKTQVEIENAKGNAKEIAFIQKTSAIELKKINAKRDEDILSLQDNFYLKLIDNVAKNEKQLVYEHIRQYDFPSDIEETIGWIHSLGSPVIESYEPDHRHALLVLGKE